MIIILTLSRVALSVFKVSQESGWYCLLCSTGILNTEWIVWPWILWAAVPVGARSKIVMSPGASDVRSILVHAP